MNDLEKIKKEVIDEQSICIDGNFEGYEVNEIIEDVLKEFIEKLDLPVVKNCGVLEKAKQMQKEQKYIYDECDGNYEENTIYQHGVLHGIDRIVKLIERHCS